MEADLNDHNMVGNIHKFFFYLMYFHLFCINKNVRQGFTFPSKDVIWREIKKNYFPRMLLITARVFVPSFSRFSIKTNSSLKSLIYSFADFNLAKRVGGVITLFLVESFMFAMFFNLYYFCVSRNQGKTEYWKRFRQTQTAF